MREPSAALTVYDVLPRPCFTGVRCVLRGTVENGVKVSCIYYIAKACLVIAVPIMFSLNGRASGWGGVDGRTESACQFTKGCPDFGSGPAARHKMWELMYDADECTKNGGSPIMVTESMNDHSMGDTEIWFSIRAATISFAAVGAGLNLRAMLRGSNEYVAPLARSLIFLVFCEIIAEIFAHNAIDDRCEGASLGSTPTARLPGTGKRSSRLCFLCSLWWHTAYLLAKTDWLTSLASVTDAEVRQAYSCAETTATLGGGEEMNLSNPAMQCEDHRAKLDAGAFTIGVLLNFYICWIVHSYGKSVRGEAAGPSGASIAGESPA